MSHYYTRYCEKHGEWDDDVDNPSDCPKCKSIPKFEGFGKIPRFSRDIIITEKIDGTNAQIFIPEDSSYILAGSRTKWITPGNDNHGFARWVEEHQNELLQLGPGRHFGEWWGKGINRGYGVEDKRFSLFNVKKWSDPLVRPSCCSVVPVLYEGPWENKFDGMVVDQVLWNLKEKGSQAAPGFMKPEGIVIYHTAGNLLFKKTIEGDEKPKGVENADNS